ncbi:fatty acid amide hydrolase-like, partial [Trifolium medium]|nr:fatty acid amide hydrolase-like [Trifolium medium]
MLQIRCHGLIIHSKKEGNLTVSSGELCAVQLGKDCTRGLINGSVYMSTPCLPTLSFNDDTDALGSLRIGIYTPWFNNVHSTEVSDKCEDALNLLRKAHGCEVKEVVIPEIMEMRTAHLVSIGSE